MLDPVVRRDFEAFKVVVDTELVGEDRRGRQQMDAGESRRFDQGGGRDVLDDDLSLAPP